MVRDISCYPRVTRRVDSSAPARIPRLVDPHRHTPLTATCFTDYRANFARPPYISCLIFGMSDWVYGYQTSVLQLAQYAYKQGLCASTVGKGFAMDMAIKHIAAQAVLPKGQRYLALCWTSTHEHEPQLIWKLGERVNTRSSSELHVRKRDLPPDPKSLGKLAELLGTDMMPRWYIREDSYSPAERRIRGWSAEDEAETARRGTSPSYGVDSLLRWCCVTVRPQYERLRKARLAEQAAHRSSSCTSPSLWFYLSRS